MVNYANSVTYKVFDAPKSKFEDNMRRGAVMINIGFAVVDVLGIGTPDNYAKFIESLTMSKQNNPWEWVSESIGFKN